jgi:ribosome biogenesis GTPase
LKGKIIKGIAGFYYVNVALAGEQTSYECKARGIFRKEGVKPLVGDNVELEVVDAENKIGNITAILPRLNALVRPAVANIDQAMIIFAIAKPDPNYNLLDRFLVTMEKQGIPCLVCFNKEDLATAAAREELKKAYEDCGFQVVFCSAANAGKPELTDTVNGMSEVCALLKGKATVFAGPSGVGKSTILNHLYPPAHATTDSLSRKIERGRHTTRHAEIYALGEDTYICDTPGFSSLYLSNLNKEELKNCYPEFAPYAASCRFRECAHISEPDCSVKTALAQGAISALRYNNYLRLYEELKAGEY